MTTYAEDARELDALRDKYPLGTLELETSDGRRWKRRMEESERYFDRYSKRWTDNRDLLCKFEKMVANFGTYVAIAYPIIDNFVADMYFHNPTAYVQSKDGDYDKGKIWSDVISSVHRECDSEREYRDSFQDQAWAGFGWIGVTFVQKPENAGDPILLAPEVEDGAPIDSGEFVQPTLQKVILRRGSPWRIRFDPKGRRWDLSDHRYLAFDTFEYLGPLVRSLESDDDRRRLMAYYARGAAAFNVENPEGTEGIGGAELDPEFIRVALRTIWSRPDHTIYRMPYGASFTFTPRPWDAEWAAVDEFPIRYMARRRVPEDKQNTEGFIGMADLDLIRPHIENINKAQGLLTDALGRVVDVYLTAKGLLNSMTMGRIEDSSRRWKILEVDLDEVNKYLRDKGIMQEKFTWDDVLHLVKGSNVVDLQHMAFIDHEFALIQQIIGQGPADRGGVADSNTATQSLGQQQGLARRMAANRSDAGKHYNAGSRMIFITLQPRQTLPLRYQSATRNGQKVWSTIRNPREAMADLDLAYEYATGSEEPRTREQEFELRQKFAQIVLPIFQAQQNWRLVLKTARDLVEPLGLLFTDQYFDDELPGLVMQLMTILRGLGVGSIGGQQVTADNVEIVKMIPELLSMIAQKVLTPDQFAQVESQVQGAQPPESGGGGVGSLAAPPSPGEASADAGARGSAAAGMLGGIQSQAQS